MEVKEIPVHSARLNIIKLTNDQRQIIVCNVYMPCDSDPTSCAEYQDILSTLSQLRPTDAETTLIIGGDLNVDLMNCTRRKPTKRLLLEFMAQENLINPSMQMCTKEQITFQNDNGSCQSNIDGFLLPTSEMGECRKLTILDDEPLNTSDHRPVILTWKTCIFGSKKVNPQSHAKPTYSKLARRRIKWDQANHNQIMQHYTIPMEKICSEIFRSMDNDHMEDLDMDQILDKLCKNMISTSLSFPTTPLNGRENNHREAGPTKLTTNTMKHYIHGDNGKQQEGPEVTIPYGILTCRPRKPSDAAYANRELKKGTTCTER